MGGKGSLILVLGFSLTMGYVSLNLNNLANRATRNMASYNEVTISHNVAQAGANVGLAALYQNPWLRGLITDQTLMNGAFDVSRMIVRMDSLNLTTLRLRSVAGHLQTAGGSIRDTVEVFFSTIKKNSFTLYFWMTDVEGNVFWVTGDTVWGRVHSNGNLHMAGEPVFFEKVTTAGMIDPNPGSGGNNAVFKNGYETGVADIEFPLDLSELIAASDPVAGGKRYDPEIWIQLDGGTAANDDGWAYVYDDAAMAPGNLIDSVNIADPTFTGVILGKNLVHVKGELDGQLSLTSLQSVIVEDNILYENRDLSASDDVLGLIAEVDVIVANNAANQTDCVIDGSVFSRTDNFIVEDYNKGATRGRLFVNGSIVQRERGAVGTFAGNKLKTGYLKSYRYDPRLADATFRPPYYPGYYTKTLAITNWWESIRIPEYN
jgi:hypothetical protein